MSKKIFIHNTFLIAILLLVFFIQLSCSDRKASEIYELAEFEELQMNYDHAIELYQDIVTKYPNAEIALQASQKVSELKNKKQLIMNDRQTSKAGEKKK